MNPVFLYRRNTQQNIQANPSGQVNISFGRRCFEQILQGHNIQDAPNIASRICAQHGPTHNIGISTAIEDALNIVPAKKDTLLRKLLCCAQYIGSHATHLYFDVLPHCMGYEDQLPSLAFNQGDMRYGTNLMDYAKNINQTIGGRDIHPMTPTLTGFTKTPNAHRMQDLWIQSNLVLEDAEKTLEIISEYLMPPLTCDAKAFVVEDGLSYPHFTGPVEGDEMIEACDFTNKFDSYSVAQSSAEHILYRKKTVRCGALSRVNTFPHRLNPKAQAEKRHIFPAKNPYQNILAQAIELIHYVEETQILLEELVGLTLNKKKVSHASKEKNKGYSLIESPHGIQYYGVTVDDDKIVSAQIITADQINLAAFQQDLMGLVETKNTLTLSQKKSYIRLLQSSYDLCPYCMVH